MATKLPIERYTGPLLSPLIRFEYQSSPTHTSSHRHFPNVSCCSSLLLSVCLCSLSKITNIATTNLYRLENILKIECSDLSSGVYSCLCVRARLRVCVPLSSFSPPFRRETEEVLMLHVREQELWRKGCQITSFPFGWWVVVNGGVCVCVWECVWGALGDAGHISYKHHSSGGVCGGDPLLLLTSLSPPCSIINLSWLEIFASEGNWWYKCAESA